MAGDSWRSVVVRIPQRDVAQQQARDRKARNVLLSLVVFGLLLIATLSLVGHMATSSRDEADQTYNELVAYASRREATAKSLAEMTLARVPTNTTARSIINTPADGNETLHSAAFASAQLKFSTSVADLLEFADSKQTTEMAGTPTEVARQLRDQELRFQQKVRQYNMDADSFNSLSGNLLLSPIVSVVTSGKMVTFTAG